jgi:iron complex transport system permease protein
VNRRAKISLALLVLVLAGAVAWRLLVGGPLDALTPEGRLDALSIRGFRIATGATVGLCLAVAGVLLQSLLRNPLASPDIMGMSSAASLGVMLSIYAAATSSGLVSLAAVRPWQALPALVGALAALALVYALSQRRGLIDPTSLVLIGVVVSIMCGSGVLLVQHLLPGAALTAGALRLLVGAISDDVSRGHLGAVAGVGIGATLLAARLGPAMDAASLGDDEAASLGVPVRALRLALLGLAGLLTAGAVVLAGPLGFVGLVAPHTVRLLAGPGLGSGGKGSGSGKWGGNRLVVLGSALAGPALVIGADALVGSVEFRSGRMPIGIVTGLVGGAVFIALLRAERRA